MAARTADTVHVLVVAGEVGLRTEFEAALAGVRAPPVVTHHATGWRQGVEAARFRSPDVVCVEIGRDLGPVRAFARDVLAVAPQALLAGIYRPEDLAAGDAEGRILIDAMRARIQDFLRRPVSTADLQQLLDRCLHAERGAPVHLGVVAAFISNRGGVGKSTLAVNTAVILARDRPGRVLLIDGSLQLGVCATMLDLKPATTIVDAARERDRVDEMLLEKLAVPHACGLRLLAAAPDAIEAAEISDETLTRILGLARRTFDYVVVDTFPMIDSILLAVLDLADRAYVVVQGTVPGVTGAAALLRVLDRVGFGVARQRLVLSHNYARFPGDLTPDDVESGLDRDLDHMVPYDRRLLQALNHGVPLSLRATSRWGFGRVTRDIADEIVAMRGDVEADAAERPPGLLARLRGRRQAGA
jgi:pilus assembly protein CpaE